MATANATLNSIDVWKIGQIATKWKKKSRKKVANNLYQKATKVSKVYLGNRNSQKFLCNSNNKTSAIQVRDKMLERRERLL